MRSARGTKPRCAPLPISSSRPFQPPWRMPKTSSPAMAPLAALLRARRCFPVAAFASAAFASAAFASAGFMSSGFVTEGLISDSLLSDGLLSGRLLSGFSFSGGLVSFSVFSEGLASVDVFSEVLFSVSVPADGLVSDGLVSRSVSSVNLFVSALFLCFFSLCPVVDSASVLSPCGGCLMTTPPLSKVSPVVADGWSVWLVAATGIERFSASAVRCVCVTVSISTAPLKSSIVTHASRPQTGPWSRPMSG